MKLKSIFMILSLLVVNNVSAQKCFYRGTVLDKRGMPLSDVLVYTIQDIKVKTDKQGKYVLNGPCSEITIFFSAIGFKNNVITSKPDDSAVITLSDSLYVLDDIEIAGKSVIEELRESSYPVSVLDARSLYNRSENTTDMVNRISGVRVRQDGGFGSSANFSLNGISGKQVKFFIDGIPADFFGAGLGINVVPVNLLERIEVYKGVVPVQLGGDALGGAVQVITRTDKKEYVDAAYSFGSFNTHKSSLNSRIQLTNKGLYIHLNSFYNHSDNSYQVNVEVPDRFGRPVLSKVTRFHDRYSNFLFRTELGLKGNKPGDDIALQIFTGGIRDEIQHDLVMSEVYGKANTGENSVGAGIRFKKAFFANKVNLNFFGGYTYTRSFLTDTSLNAYNWDGKIFIRRDYGGEISTSGSLRRFNIHQTVARVNAEYSFGERNKVILSQLFNHYNRTGTDPVAAVYYGEDIFNYPNALTRYIPAISLEHDFPKARVKLVSSLKYFTFHSTGFSFASGNQISKEAKTTNQWGGNFSGRWFLSPSILFKSAYEYAARLPDSEELFGNFYAVNPNAGLVPEVSHNINAGIMYQKTAIRIELNGFYRKTFNTIYLRTSRFFAQYQNLLEAEIKGVEADFMLTPVKGLTISLNATYQDIINKSKGDKSGTIDDRYYNARLPNIPIYYTNQELRYKLPGSLTNMVNLELWWNAYYTGAFFLSWEQDGIRNKKAQVPAQFIQNTGITISKEGLPLTFSFEVFNLTNTMAHDNFNVQKPGRAFSARLRFYIDNLKLNNKTGDQRN